MIDSSVDSLDEFLAARSALDSLIVAWKKSEGVTPAEDVAGPSTPPVADDDPEVEFDATGNVSVTSPPPPVVHAAPPPPPTTAAPLLTHDSRGIPWDGRVHASNRATKIDGSWKSRRGVDPALLAQIEAGSVPGNTPPPPMVSVAGVPTPLNEVGAAVEALKAPPPPPPSDAAPPPPPATVPAGEPVTFKGVMQKIMKNPSVFTDTRLNEVLEPFGLSATELVKLIGNPILPSVNAAIDACLT
jgi:hypothetical protein